MQKSDRNFDNIAAKFSRNIYDTTKGKIRQQVLIRDLGQLAVLQQPCRILDVGAGQGQIALHLAALGHQVLLTDISAEMLAIAQKTAAKLNLTAEFQQVSLSELVLQHQQRYQIILCHAMLEWLAEPQLAIAQLKKLLAPGGIVSLMFYNKDAKRLSNIIYGNFAYVAADMQVKKKVRLSPQSPLQPNEVLSWCQEAGLKLITKTGVRCFHDYLRNPEQQQTEFEQLLALELEYNQIEPYASLGRYQHFLLQA
ncbi:methyltransferase domain-containing protein [Rheinheimera sp. MMS21-TC3]|uniref:methyltransferase domain-containing protein n=1 Tax=Rheinheimera sp. MMS21-TC3 TaxID=3072790 RepID=UPI0028C42804|nr:methyltransferase domain-containing protein [Rheinheimera sp. MMS21-TC3]WNO61234.1 methyltransferase domain-containing protein [Rheinheimera sp. MMS21-TC3]